MQSTNGTDKVVKHLEMTQSVISRLGRNSFLVKNWSMTILVAAVVLNTRENLQGSYFALLLFIPTASFWIIDSFFLWQERLFRQIYDEVRQQDDTDFIMNVERHADKPRCNFPSAIFSVTHVVFYLSQVFFVCGVVLFSQL